MIIVSFILYIHPKLRDEVFVQFFKGKIVEVFFKKLLNNFHIVHNHPNNHGKLLNLNGFVVPQFMEMTFLRKDRSPIEGYSNEFPHALDRPCYAGHPEIALPSNWHA